MLKVNDSITQYEVLQTILGSYIDGHKSILKDNDNPPRLTFEFVTMALGYKNLARDFFLKILLDDGHLKRNENTSDGEPLIVTTNGRKFWNNGGYLKEQMLNQVEEEIKLNTVQKLRLDRKVFWIPILISLLALGFAASTFILNYQNSKADVSLIPYKLVSGAFNDKDGKKKIFGVYRAIIGNNGNRPVTLLGLKPYYGNSGILLTTYKGSNDAHQTNVEYKIFRIPDTLMTEQLLDKEENLWNFRNEGLEKLSVLNKVIPPGEIYSLNIGAIFDLFSDTTKHYSTMIFTTELLFSNGQKLNFGAGGNIGFDE